MFTPAEYMMITYIIGIITGGIVMWSTKIPKPKPIPVHRFKLTFKFPRT